MRRSERRVKVTRPASADPNSSSGAGGGTTADGGGITLGTAQQFR